MPRVALIVNPHASAVSPDGVAAVEAALRKAGEVQVLRTTGPGEATELARGAGADAVVVYGGDGAANEVLNGLDSDVPVGFLPGGGTSVLPRALGLPRDAEEAAERVADALTRRRLRRISLGRVNGRRFAFSAGVGLDAELVRRVDAKGRTLTGRRAGDLAFAWAAAQLLRERRATFPPVLDVRGFGRAAFVFVANGRPYTYAGPVALDVAPQARFELGLDFVAPVRVDLRSVPRLLGYAVRGHGQDDASDVLYGHDLDGIDVICDTPLPLQADGEDLGDATTVVFEAERGTVDVLV